MALCLFMFVEQSHSCVLFGAAIVTVTCALCIIRGEECTHTTGMLVGGYRKVEETCHNMMDLGGEFSG
jgi:hypothetical protein